jgi:apolipoprotein D and lipocalin family protein
MRRYLTATATALAAALAFPAATMAQGAVEVDPDAYGGLWYEIARTPAPFQAQCDGGVTARYDIDDDTIRVLNRCDTAAGAPSSIEGTAEAVGEGIARLSVSFPGAPDDAGVDYRVVGLGPEEDGRYAWAAVVGGDREIGWVLARDTELDQSAREEAEAALEAAGIDRAALSDTPQPPQTYDPEADAG